MKITIVPAAVGAADEQPLHFLTSYLVNDSIAIDAGCIGLMGTPRDQARIKHILITHTHMDHIASLPIFIENVYESGTDPVTIYGSEAVLECLQKDLFNDRLWPDFIALSMQGASLLKLQTLRSGEPIQVEGLRITPVAVNHVVPTCGFIVEDEGGAVVIASDTAPTEEIWQRANANPHLKAVFLEATFPNALAFLAEVAKHLTPNSFAREVRKVKKPVAIIAVHIKARFYARIVEELKALQIPGLEIARYGDAYHF